MYIIIWEDQIFKIDKITQNELDEVDTGDGWMQIISISGPQPTEYRNGEWYGIGNWIDESEY